MTVHYFARRMDHYSHFTCVYLLKINDEVIEKFKNYIAFVTVVFSLKVTCLIRNKYINNILSWVNIHQRNLTNFVSTDK